MPRHGGLVTILTTGLVAQLGALIGSGLLVAGAGGETVRQGGLQVSFGGSVAPQVLPRTGTTPVSVAIRGGVQRSYLSTGCPAPAGFTSTTFPLLRAAYAFVGAKTVSDTLVRTCRTGG